MCVTIVWMIRGDEMTKIIEGIVDYLLEKKMLMTTTIWLACTSYYLLINGLFIIEGKSLGVYFIFVVMEALAMIILIIYFEYIKVSGYFESWLFVDTKPLTYTLLVGTDEKGDIYHSYIPTEIFDRQVADGTIQMVKRNEGCE